MELIEGLMTRTSIGQLESPGPSENEINIALNCAMRAPDHGRMKPWRFHLVQAAANHQLGQLFAEEAERKARVSDRPFTDKQKEKFLAMPLRAPLIIVVTALLKEHKIPRVEQCLAVGSAAQNLQLAFHALGFGCIWRTGEMAQAGSIKGAFGLTTADELVAFLYVGRPSRPSALLGVKSICDIQSYPSSYAILKGEDQAYVFHWSRMQH